MLCRYETPLWAEMNLEGTADETALIRTFLLLVQVKTPLLVWEALWGRNGCSTIPPLVVDNSVDNLWESPARRRPIQKAVDDWIGHNIHSQQHLYKILSLT